MKCESRVSCFRELASTHGAHVAARAQAVVRRCLSNASEKIFRLLGRIVNTVMARKAGERLRGAVGVDKVDNIDIVTALAALGGIGGLTVTGLTSILDLFSGESRIDNSGEYLANSAISAIPLGTAAAGAGIAAGRDPIARGLMDVVGNTVAAQSVGQAYGANAMASALTEGRVAPPGSADVEDAGRRVKESEARVLDAMRRKIQSDPKLAGMAPEQAAELLMRRASHGLARGAGLGALAGSVPAVMAMMDGSASPRSEEM